MIIHIYQDMLAEVKNERELGAHGIFKGFRLVLCPVARRKFKDLFREQLEYGHGVETEGLVVATGVDDVGRESSPVLGPFSSQNLDQHDIDLTHVQVGRIVLGSFADEAHDVFLDRFAVLPWKCFPSRFD